MLITAVSVTENAPFIYAILKSSHRFAALRDLVVHRAEEEVQQYALRRKEQAETESGPNSPRSTSISEARSPSGARSPPLSNVPEEQSAFTIGDDDESEDDSGAKLTPSRSSSHSEPTSRQASVSSPTEDAVPSQLRGMSEKARGKMPVGHSSFSRQGSSASLSNLAMRSAMSNGRFEPTATWVSSEVRKS